MGKFKDENVMRVDVRIPLEFYSEIENIAIATNQPPTPKSKNTDNPKPSVTTIILKLIELGLGVIENEGIEVLGEGNIKPLPNTQVSDKIEDKLFKRLEARLEQLLETRLRADTPKIKEDSDNTLPDTLPVNEDKKVSAIEGNSEPINEVIKSFDEAVIEINRLKKEGLGNTAIAKELTDKFYTKQNRTNWTDTQVKRVLNPPKEK